MDEWMNKYDDFLKSLRDEIFESQPSDEDSPGAAAEFDELILQKLRLAYEQGYEYGYASGHEDGFHEVDEDGVYEGPEVK